MTAKIITKKPSQRQNVALVKKIEKLTAQIKVLQDKLNEAASEAASEVVSDATADVQ
jgi:cell division protein FtsB